MPDCGTRARGFPWGWGLGLLVLAFGPAAGARAQPVQGDVRSVGFQAAVSSRFIIRHGQWFPILVELTAQGSQAYDVELRCEQVDLDGDRIVYVEPHVAVTPEAGLRRAWCHAVALRDSLGQPMTVDVIGADQTLITSLLVPPFESISNDTELVLDISGKRVTGLDALDDGAMQYGAPNWGNRRHYRTVCVASLPARDLPDRWWGLEAVDVIVWDEPDPDQLSNAQLVALAGWVHNGGQLLVGIGPAWTKLQRGVWTELMPLVGTQPTVEVDQLPTLARKYAAADEGFKNPVSVAVGEPPQDALVTFQDRLPDNRVLNLIALRLVGSGRVVATAARLRDLAALHPSSAFYQELLDLNRNTNDFLKKEGEEGWSVAAQVRSLYEPLIGQIEFRRTASARVLAAFAFVAAYILVSTFGAWSWLKRHALTHLSWVAFAVFALVASLLSLGAVGLSRGVVGTLHSLSFVDLESGSNAARVTTYFGYKSSRRQRVEVALPGAENYLRPLSSGPELSVPYATPERYFALAGRATLADTPLRATLKQFEGFWQGSVPGTIRGGLTADRGSGMIAPGSWLQNDLDIEIVSGCLLYIDPRLQGRDGVPYRVAGLDQRNDRPQYENKYYGSDRVPAAVNVLLVDVPRIKPGERVSGLGTEQYNRYDQDYSQWTIGATRDPKREPMLPTLWQWQIEQWVPRPGSWEAAALLASTRDLYLHNAYRRQNPDFSSVGNPLGTTGLLDQDVTHWLVRGQAVLLLLADTPGPAQLHVGGKPRESDQGCTIYRVRIPIRYTGLPSRGATP